MSAETPWTFPAERHGHVPVVAAGVHAAFVAARKRQPRRLLDGQGVHVGADRHGLRPPQVKVGAHGAAAGLEDLAAEPFKHAAHVGGGLGKLVVELGDAMEVAADTHELLEVAGGASAEYAVGISVPLSLLGVAATYSVASFNAVFVHLQEKWISEGKLKAATRIPIYSNISEFVVRFFPIFFACYLGADYMPSLIALIPEWLANVFQVLGGILPAVGFGLLIKFTLKKNVELLFVIVGFIMMAVLDMPIVAVTFVALFIAYVDYLGSKKEGAC